jgi:hypothetical protein
MRSRMAKRHHLGVVRVAQVGVGGMIAGEGEQWGRTESVVIEAREEW